MKVKKKQEPQQEQQKTVLARASESIAQYFDARKRLDEEMDERLIEETVADFDSELTANRVLGKGQWWDKERCNPIDLVNLAQQALTSRNFLSAAIYCMMVHVRTKHKD